MLSISLFKSSFCQSDVVLSSGLISCRRLVVKHLLSRGQFCGDLQLHSLSLLSLVSLVDKIFLLCLLIMAPIFSIQL